VVPAVERPGRSREAPVSILVTGDTHGDMRRFNNQNMRRQCDGEYPSHVLIAGDFGLVYSTNPDDRLERELVDWLDAKPWETVALLGNHENYERAYALPLAEHLGAPMYRVSEKVWLMQHGNVYTIEGKTFFAFGGAASIDRASRQDRISWWEEEVPTRADVDRGVRSLAAVGGKVDYVITHTAPREAVDTVIGKPLILGDAGREREEAQFYDPTVALLMELRGHIDLGTLKEWFFGHFHTEAVFRGSITGFLYHGLYMDFARIR